MGSPEEELVRRYDSALLGVRYWASMGLISLVLAFDYFDFFIVGYFVGPLAQQWQLTFGQTSLILLSAGVGAIVGALIWGTLADHWGRKPLTVAGVAICASSAGLISVIPDGAWITLAGLRFLVGVGIGATAAVVQPLIVEYTPTRHRTILGSAMIIPVSLGILLASATAATLFPLIGWRGLACLGLLPLIPGVLIAIIVPESVRWLVAHGRYAQARRIVEKELGRRLDDLPRPANTAGLDAALPQVTSSFSDLFAYRRLSWLTAIVWFAASTISYGVLLWGPTVVALLMGVSPADAARLFVFVSISGISGRIAFSIMPQLLGRRRCGEIMGYGSSICLAAAAVLYDRVIFGYPAFVVLLLPATFFFDGGFANIAPYAAEVFPVRLNARGAALAQAANGIGKIVGPLCLALIAGTSNLITPKATIEAVTPAFLFLAGCGLAVGLAFSLLGVETHGKPLSLADANRDAPPRVTPWAAGEIRR